MDYCICSSGCINISVDAKVVRDILVLNDCTVMKADDDLCYGSAITTAQ